MQVPFSAFSSFLCLLANIIMHLSFSVPLSGDAVSMDINSIFDILHSGNGPTGESYPFV